jgi:hypothetical protein
MIAAISRKLRGALTHPLYPLQFIEDAELFSHSLDSAGRCSKEALDRLPPSLWRSDALTLHQVPHRYAPDVPMCLAEDRAVGAVMGMAVGDSLGAQLEFLPYRARGSPASLGDDGNLLPGAVSADKFSLRPGQWTDDTAMGLCLLDSLLVSAGGPLRPTDLLLRFCAWWWSGYNNAFGE